MSMFLSSGLSTAQLQSSLMKRLSTVISQNIREMSSNFGVDLLQIPSVSGVFVTSPLLPPPPHREVLSDHREINAPGSVSLAPVHLTSTFPDEAELATPKKLLPSMFRAPSKVLPDISSKTFSQPPAVSPFTAFEKQVRRKPSFHQLHQQSSTPARSWRQVKLTDMMVIKKRRSVSFKGNSAL